MNLTTAPNYLCQRHDIEDGEAKGFTLGSGEARREIFVVREGEALFGYENSCPHIGTPLDWVPDQFISADGSYILCATHGALFEIEIGHCISGPCAGLNLKPVSLSVDTDGQVFLSLPGAENTEAH